MKNKKVIACMIAAVFAASMLSGCGTTVVSNTNEYFSQVSSRMNTLAGSKEDSTAKVAETETADENAIAAPANFTVDNDGNYSFDSVEEADSYIIYVYATGSTSYDYVTNSITGEGTITGSIADLNYPYGDYTIAIVAYPDYTDTEHNPSAEVTCQITKTGEVETPELTFFWDCFSQQLQILWTNSSAYSTTGYPVSMDVTITGDAESSTTISMDSATTTYVVDGAAVGDTYEVSADVAFDEEYVTNPSIQVELGEVTCYEERSMAPDGYEYNSGIYTYADYPLFTESFDLTNGGEIGRWKVNAPASGMGWGMSESTAEYLIYTGTPVATEDGDAYTFSFEAVNDDASAVKSTNFGEIYSLTGTLHLHEDGSFLMVMDDIYICTDQISGAKQYHNGSSVEGAWYDNGDGTASLSFNLATEQDLGHE